MDKLLAILSSKYRNKKYSVLIDGKNFIDQPVKNYQKTYKIRRFTTGQGDDYTTHRLLDFVYFKNYYKLIPKDLSKQQVLLADPKEIQQINFTRNLERGGQTSMCFNIEEVKKKKKKSDFLQRPAIVMRIYFSLIYYQYKMTKSNTLNV